MGSGCVLASSIPSRGGCGSYTKGTASPLKTSLRHRPSCILHPATGMPGAGSCLAPSPPFELVSSSLSTSGRGKRDLGWGDPAAPSEGRWNAGVLPCGEEGYEGEMGVFLQHKGTEPILGGFQLFGAAPFGKLGGCGTFCST